MLLHLRIADMAAGESLEKKAHLFLEWTVVVVVGVRASECGGRWEDHLKFMVLEITCKAKYEDEDGDLPGAYYMPGSVVNAFHVFIYVSPQPQVRLAVIILIPIL